MCGRMVVARAAGDLVGRLDIYSGADDPSMESFNVAPTTTVPIVLTDERIAQGQPSLAPARWGLVPSWSKGTAGPPLINARVETVTTKPSFRSAARSRRALVPADGYYEWQATPDGKQPYYLSAPGQGLLFAALYEYWRDPASPEDAGWLRSFTVITTTASDALGHIHDRSPVIVPEDRLDEWLDPGLHDKEDVDRLLASLPEPHLDPVPVSRRVNSVKNDSEDLTQPVSL